MFTSAVMFGLMAFTAKLASARISGAQVAAIRFMVGLLPCLVIPQVRRAALTWGRVDLLFYRGFFGGLAVLFYFLAIEHTNVGVATLLNYTAPIFSGLFSVLFIGERISPRVLIPMPVALIGVFLVVHGNARPGDLLGMGRWELAGLASAICSGIAVTAMRAARRTENSWAVYGSLCALGIVTTLPLAVRSWRTPTPTEWFWLMAMALFAIAAQLLLTFSLKYIDAMTAGIVSQVAVVITMVLGAVVLHEHIPNLAILGSVLAIGGVLGVVYVTATSKPAEAVPVEVVP